MTYRWDILLSGVGLLFIAVVTAVQNKTVDTTSGFVMGTRYPGSSVIRFLGIPYAEPPTGERRFKPPMRKTRMTQIYNATADGFACPQMVFKDINADVVTSEDCLYLNVFVPENATKTDPLSVMVWVYGGGYTVGSSSFFESTVLAQLTDVIVVVINYRIGILGFLNTMDDNAVGNFGLRDQCSALQWVNENIEEFGGNRSSITIFGESAGAGSVTQLTMAASCEGLFHRVIAQSGSALGSWAYNPNPLKSALDLGGRMGCPTDKTSSLVQCLRGKSTDELLEQQVLGPENIGSPSWAPSYTSDFFSFVPKELPLWKGIPVENKMADFDLLTGLNMEEGESFYELIMAPLRATGQMRDRTDGLPFASLNQSLTQAAHITLPGDIAQADKLLPSLWFRYTDWQNRRSKFTHSKMLVELIGDTMLHVSSVQYARLHAELGGTHAGDGSGRGKTYFYRLKHRPSWQPSNPWSVGATHGDDIPFLFGWVLLGIFNATAEEMRLSQVMMEYWTNFAKTGNPNEPSRRYIVTDWPTYTSDEEQYLELDISMDPGSTGKHPYASRVAFWNDFLPEQVKIIENEVEQKPCYTTTAAGNVNAHGYASLIVPLCGFLSVNLLIRAGAPNFPS